MANTGTLNSMKSNEETSKMYTGIETKSSSDIEDQGPGGGVEKMNQSPWILRSLRSLLNKLNLHFNNPNIQI